MNGIINSHPEKRVPTPMVPEGIGSLVKGEEAGLLERIMPLVRRQSVWLDLGSVERIDAAGIATLITLYRTAQEAGRCFGVINPRPHVREVLTLVGLNRFLLSENAEAGDRSEPELVESAA